MSIWKLISLMRLGLLLFMVALLINGGNYIEGGILAVYVLLDIAMSRIRKLERMFREMKELREANELS